MTDVHSKATRSYNMSRIGAKDTKPELILRKKLFSLGYRYRLHSKDLPGKPDIVLSKYNVVIFVNGCFWHGHEGCSQFKVPETNREWWLEKISKTKERDTSNREKLRDSGWKVITVWECEIKSDLESVLRQIESEFKSLK